MQVLISQESWGPHGQEISQPVDTVEARSLYDAAATYLREHHNTSPGQCASATCYEWHSYKLPYSPLGESIRFSVISR